MSKAITKTKLICTIGPASNDEATIRKMIENGMNVARLNFSHGTHESHRATIQLVRKIAKEMGVNIGFLQDLCGPKIRLGKLPEEGVRLLVGDYIALASTEENCENALPVEYPELHKEVQIGERILLADGMMELRVTGIDGVKVLCEVITGGVAYTKKGVNMPQSDLHVLAFSEKDRKDLAMGLEEKIDFVALSFVRSAKDLEEIKRILDNSNHRPLLIAKIEKPQAVENLEEILDVVDGVMVARGDLGVEMPLEQMPHVQKRIITQAKNAGRITITATQMLASMVKAQRPTRSETTDVANAVIDGTDALMLSDETANGNYPEIAVETLARIARAAEMHSQYTPDFDSSLFRNSHSYTLAIGRAACWLAKDVGAKAIVSYSATGLAPYCISRFRPDCELLVLTFEPRVCSGMSLIWGAQALYHEVMTDMDSVVETAKIKAIETGLVEKGDTIIVTAGMPFGKTGTTSLLRLVQI